MNKQIMVMTSLVATLAASQAAQAQQGPASDGWSISAGAGVVDSPRTLGSKKTRVMAVPRIDVRYQDWFFANPIQGIGLQTRMDGFKLSAAVGADTNSRDPKGGDRYANLSKISIAPAVRLAASYELGDFTTEAVVSSRIATGTKGGTTLQLEESYDLYSTAKAQVSVGATVRLMDNTFARNLVSISVADSAASGLPVYLAKSGLLDAGVFVQAVMPITDRWTLFSKLQLNTFEGDAKSSPLVEKRTSSTFLLFASYSF